MIACVVKIQLRLCPNLSVNNGIFIRSTSGDHKKLMLYATKIKPNRPILERDNSASLSQPLIAEPIITQGKPLAIPKQKILRRRLSLK